MKRGFSDEYAAGHNGNSDNPFRIYDERSLAAFANETNMNSALQGGFSGKYIRLMKDLDLNGASHKWEPIGNTTLDQSTDKIFKGTFDGDNHTISNMTVNVTRPGSDYAYAGLFGYVMNATIKDVGVVNASVTATSTGYAYAGGLVGSTNRRSITNSVALNPQVSASGSGTIYIGRVVGSSTGTRTNNYAWDGMTGGTWTGMTANGKDGANASSAYVWANLTFWQSVFNGDISTGDTAVWKITDPGDGSGYPLPYLRTFDSPDTLRSQVDYLKPVTLTYDGNTNTSGSVPAPTKHSNNTFVTLADNTGNLAKTGHTFGGWNTESDGSGNNYGEGNTFTITGDRTLYANWTANVTDITLDRNGGTGGTGAVNITYNSSSFNTSINNPTKTGHTFHGWYNETGGLGTLVIEANGTLKTNVAGYTNSSSYWINENRAITLYANWTANKTKVILTNYTGFFGEITLTYNASVSPITPPARTGYTFHDWYNETTGTNGKGTQIFNVTGEIQKVAGYATNSTGHWKNDTCEITLYANWTANSYTVTLNADGGTIAAGKEVTQYTYGIGATLPTSSDITKANFNFAGWYDNSGLTETPVTSISATDTGDKTFYANWTTTPTPPPATYTVTVQNDGHGTCTASCGATAAPGDTVTLTASPNPGYRFTQWQVVAGGVTITGNTFTMPAADVKMIGQFEAKTITPVPPAPSFDSGSDGYSSTSSGTVSSTGKVTFGTSTGITGVSFPAGTAGTVILDSDPAGVTAPADTFAVFDLSDPAFAGYAQIEFSVPTALLTDRGLTVNDVALRHFTGGRWVPLTTHYLGEDRGAANYIAATPSLSPFAIVYEQGGAETIEYATPEPTAAAPVTGTQNVTAQSAVTPPAAEATNAGADAQPTLTQAPVPLAGMLFGLLAAGLLLRRRA